jgi:hypothetical protein
LSELADGTFPNTKANLVARIMDFFTAEEVTLSVELTAFYATYANGATVFWNTASETNLLGYNLYRNSCSDISNAVKLNSLIIPATGLAKAITIAITIRKLLCLILCTIGWINLLRWI